MAKSQLKKKALETGGEWLPPDLDDNDDLPFGRVKVTVETPANLLNHAVVKSNALARASHDLSLIDKRVAEMMIGKIDSSIKLNQYMTVDITLHATEYAEATGTSLKRSYGELKNSVSALVHTVITIQEGNSRVQRPLMFEARYIDEEGKIIASFHPKFLPHILGLNGEFTKYYLRDALRFKSAYTWKIYEMCMSIKNQKNAVLKLRTSEFRSLLVIPESYRWINVRRLIESAKTEIETKTDLKLEVDFKKKGRAFEWIFFHVGIQAQKKLDI